LTIRSRAAAITPTREPFRHAVTRTRVSYLKG
jgi:hypothetical protein